MSISAIGNTGGFDLSKIASRIAARTIKDFDSDGDGSLDKKEFVAGLTAKGVSADEAAKQFDSIDTKKVGKISQTDIETAVKAAAEKNGPPPGSPPPGGRPAGGPGKAGGADGASGTHIATTYDKKDTNKDGTVSAIEELTYDLKNLDVASAGKLTTTPALGSNVDVTA